MVLTPLVIFNFIILLIFTLAYFYQLVFLIRGLIHGDVVLPKAKKNHSYAFVIAAHNEEPVIGNLVRSILTQKYDGLIDCFVVADACTDNTFEEAQKAGAVVEATDELPKSFLVVSEYGESRVILTKYNAAVLLKRMQDAQRTPSPVKGEAI